MCSGENITAADMGLTETAVISADDMGSGELPAGFSLENKLESIERKYIAAALRQAGNCKTKAAELLGFTNYQRLDARMKKLKISHG